MRTNVYVLCGLLLLATAAGLRAQMTTSDVIRLARERMEGDLRNEEQKLEAIRTKVDELRKTIGLPPVNLADANTTSIVDRTIFYISRLEQWPIDLKNLEAAESRLKIAKSMSPQEREVASRLYVSCPLSNSILSPHGTGDKWLMDTITLECEVLTKVVEQMRKELGNPDPSIKITRDSARSIEDAHQQLLFQWIKVESLKNFLRKQ